ncbi:RND superfamily putative drug exporter [Asanoa ferruginea]|uniref:RND superfamily putative drug exporter n=1 Tax=Asanoa ferruginea TaxID=53367 RepID=A0A3D9ZYS1_9ACTN|nr:MMPL family transporter [Asanoa ferruginea]REG01314.1 RND superfamily putative drug exporter [Asanoa ferruginea]GIF52196.1 putative membrane protein [Asanoa ferruginea]
MFERLARFVVYKRWWVIGAWLVAAVAAGAFAPSLVTTQDQADFLPNSYESVKATEIAQDAFGQTDGATATIVVKRADGGQLTDADQATVGKLATTVSGAGIAKVTTAVTGPQAVSPNKLVQLVTVGLGDNPQDPALVTAIKDIRSASAPVLANTGLDAKVTGDVALYADNDDAFNNAFVIVALASVILILALLLIIYRSPLAALLPIVTVGIVTVISTGLIATMAKLFGLSADPSIEIILTIVLYGVGTDYVVFLLFRFRERLRAGDQTKPALVTSVHRVGEVIASAAGAIVIAFLALLLAVFGAFRSLGPALAIAVVIMGLAAVTLVPAIVSLLGTAVFWPSKSWRRVPKGTAFQRLGRFTGRRPAVVALVSGGLMVALAAGALFMKTDYDQNAQLPSGTESSEGFEDLQAGFPAGALAPTQVLVKADAGAKVDPASLTAFAERLRGVPGVGSIMPGPEGVPATLSQDGTVAMVQVLLAGSPYSNDSLALAGGELRDVAHAAAPPGTQAYVGGMSSIFADVKSANDRDLRVIFPVAGVLIALILALLLRSLVAPIYLIVAVVLGFFSTLGATVIAFQGIGNGPGLSFTLPIILYLFVVAIGTDYNILMIARLREEARLGNDPRTAADLAVEHAGPSVGAAGLILAGTFASMMLAGIAFLVEMGFSVSIGILIAAFVMAMFLVPSLTALIGRRAWWPGHADTAPPAPAEPDLAYASRSTTD